ncbi:MAG: hypothetical protein ACYS7Y_16685 [Planctomycetota bacterium]
MPYHFWIPTDTEEWVHAKLTEDGNMIVYDYDVEADIALEALGMEPTPVLEAARLWENDPLAILCGKGEVIPLQDSGLAVWSWARLAVDENREDLEKIYKPRNYIILERALEVALSALTRDEYIYKSLVRAGNGVSNLIPHKLKTGYYKYHTSGKHIQATLHTVKLLLNGIIPFHSKMSYSGIRTRNTSSINSFCNARFSALGAVSDNPEKMTDLDYDRLVEVAVRTMSEFQEK